MEQFLKYLESQELKRLDADAVIGDDSSSFIHFMIDPAERNLTIESRDVATNIIIARAKPSRGICKVTLANGARLNIVEVLFDGGESCVEVVQSKDSYLNSTLVELASSNAKYSVEMVGAGAESILNMLQLPSASEVACVDLKIAHMATDCVSRSISKCAAAGSSKGEFHGLVYVAEGAQRTVSHQNSRNVALSPTAVIVAEPQLEIYADDVKCTHGATVGEMNQEAILYMRQRGLSEEQARKIQLDGFVADIAYSCPIESIRDILAEVIRERLDIM